MQRHLQYPNIQDHQHSADDLGEWEDEARQRIQKVREWLEDTLGETGE